MRFVERTAARFFVGAVVWSLGVGVGNPSWGESGPSERSKNGVAKPSNSDLGSPTLIAQQSKAQKPARPQNKTAETAPAETHAAPASSAPPAPSNPVSNLKSLIAICPSVRMRLERDHRIRLSEERYRKENRTHIYLFLSEQKLPYMVSLGWFSPGELAVEQASDTSKDSRSKKSKKKNQAHESLSKSTDLLNPISQKNKTLVAIDEFGLVLPVPGQEPKEKTYDKADWSAVVGFDRVSDHDLDGAEKEFANATKLVPVNARFNNNLGALLAAKGNYDEATQCFSRAIRENESYPGAYTNRAFVSLASGRTAAALDDAVLALKLDPTLMPARVAYGRALMETGNSVEALKVAQTLKAEAPTEWQPLLLLADAELANKQYKESKITLARLAVLNPGSADTVLKLAHANEKLGDLDEAIKQAKRATQLAPNEARTHITLGRYLDANRDANAARLQFERAMDLKPERSLRKTAMAALLRILIATDKMAMADEFTKKWVKQYPEDAACHYNRAWLASQLEGDHLQECIDGYKKTLELDASLSSVHYNLALILLKAGKNTDGLRELKAFVKELPNDSDCPSALALIKKLEGG